MCGCALGCVVWVVFEISFLSPRATSRFSSDFHIVAAGDITVFPNFLLVAAGDISVFAKPTLSPVATSRFSPTSYLSPVATSRFSSEFPRCRQRRHFAFRQTHVVASGDISLFAKPTLSPVATSRFSPSPTLSPAATSRFSPNPHCRRGRHLAFANMRPIADLSVLAAPCGSRRLYDGSAAADMWY